jgi:hypothetical protein
MNKLLRRSVANTLPFSSPSFRNTFSFSTKPPNAAAKARQVMEVQQNELHAFLLTLRNARQIDRFVLAEDKRLR